MAQSAIRFNVVQKYFSDVVCIFQLRSQTALGGWDVVIGLSQPGVTFCACKGKSLVHGNTMNRLF